MYVRTFSSGSVYNDLSLMSSLPGEFTCNKRVSVIKVRKCSNSIGVFFRLALFYGQCVSQYLQFSMRNGFI